MALLGVSTSDSRPNEEGPTVEVVFTENEIIYLDDQFTLSIPAPLKDQESTSLRNPGTSAGIAVPSSTILKFGNALLRILDEEPALAETPIMLNETELWAIRELAQHPVRIGPETVGLNLKKKIHRALVQLGNRAVVGELGLGTTEEKEDTKQVARLAKWRKRHASTHKGPDESPTNSED